MKKNTNPHALTKEELVKKVQQLEQALACLRTETDTASAKKEVLPACDKVTQVVHSEDSHAWLLTIINELTSEPHHHKIDHALAQLGKHLGLSHCNLWRWPKRHQLPEQLNTWQAADAPSMTYSWLDTLLAPTGTFASQLEAGQLITLTNTQLAQSSLTSTIQQLILVPIRWQKHTEGFMALYCVHGTPLTRLALSQVQHLAKWLFSTRKQLDVVHELSHRDTRFQYAMEASRDGLWDWNLTTGTIYFSRSYLRMLGYDYDVLPGNISTLKDYFLHPEDAQDVLTQYLAAVDNRLPHLNLEYRVLHQDGSELWIYSRVKFFEPDSKGRAQRCVGINANITDFIRSQEQLLAAKTQADIANKTKSEFLARMSHEIRTPMNAIIGLGHLLADTNLNEQQQSYLGSMNTAAESLLHIINQVLDFSKIETGKIILENSHFDLDQVFEKLSRLFEISALHKAVDVIYDIHSDVPRFLRGDTSRLSQIISHLITNALQYSTSNQVVIGVRKIKQNTQHVILEFTITDFGVGMSAEQLTQLRNSLLKNMPTELGSQHPQAGFGLSICNHLIGLMNGHLEINSQLGEGCKISFTLRFEHSHIGAKSLNDQPYALYNLRALIVDDNTIARNIIASTAHSIQLHADTADSADHAIEKIRAAEMESKPFHLVLMDYKMPYINGLQASHLIRQDNLIAQQPLIFLISSYHQDEIADEHQYATLVDGFLSKPVSESRLFDTIHQAIHSTHPLYKLINHHGAEYNDDDLLLKDLRILLVEDNIVNQQVAGGILRKKGMQVTTANNGREAIEWLSQNNNVDMILMDLEMPVMDGFQATQEIRAGKIHANIPIVAVTAQAMRGDRERCLLAGMDAYLTKPIQPELLYRTLADIFRSTTTDYNS